MPEETPQTAPAEESVAEAVVKVETEIKEEPEEPKVEEKEEKVEIPENSQENEENEPEKAEKEQDAPVAQSQYIRLRGLPFEAVEQDVVDFFGENLKFEKLKFTLTGGRPSGEAYVEFKSKEDAAEAMKFDRKEIKTRYIEVFTVSTSEGEFAWRPEPSSQESDDQNYVVRLRGIPWSCKEEDILQFFEGLEPPPAEAVIGGTGGPKSRPSGEAFVRFTSQEAATKAMEYNKRHMGSRYVEVFQSSMIELNRAKGFGNTPSSYERTGIRPLMSLDRSDVGYPAGYGTPAGYGSYDDGQRGGGGYGSRQDYGGYGSGGGGYGSDGYGSGGGGGQDYGAPDPFRIYMRGLPYDADNYAIEAFFSPLRVSNVKLGINEQARPSGDAIAEFDTYNDMVTAMDKNNQRMGRRYVELFYHRDVPGPMRRLLWKEANSYNSQPAPDAVLSGRARPSSQRDSAPYRNPREQQQRDGWAPPRGGYDRGGIPSRAPPPRAARAEPWGGYRAPAHAHSSYDQGGYGGGNSYDSYGGYGSSAPNGYSSGGYDRQREARDTVAGWGDQQRSAYGGWGNGDQRGGY